MYWCRPVLIHAIPLPVWGHLVELLFRHPHNNILLARFYSLFVSAMKVRRDYD